MNINLEINTYSRYPNIKKILATNYDIQEFACLTFEISFKYLNKNNKQTETNVFLTTSLLLDYHNNEINISFDFAAEDNSSTYLITTEDKNTPNKEQRYKKVTLDSADIVNLKKTFSQSNFKYFKNLNEVLTNYISTNIEDSIQEIRSYVLNNPVKYDKNEFNKFFKEIKKEANKLFNEDVLTTYVDYVELTNKKLLAAYLENNLKQNSTKTTHFKI